MAQEGLISNITDSIKKSVRTPALIPFIVSGFPDMDSTESLIKLFDKKDVAAIELGVPFSDPMADGPIIQQAVKSSLENGTNINKIFSLLEKIKGEISTPIILFTYFNPFYAQGIENFLSKAAKANVSGIIIPDLPLEESEETIKLCEKYSIDLIMLVAPTSGSLRIKNICKKSKGFIYLVSSTGVTGVRDNFSGDIADLIKEVKQAGDTPVAVGFGVSKPEHISKLKEINADGAIIGSAIVKIITQYQNNKNLIIENLSNYIDSLYQ